MLTEQMSKNICTFAHQRYYFFILFFSHVARCCAGDILSHSRVSQLQCVAPVGVKQKLKNESHSVGCCCFFICVFFVICVESSL